MKKERTAVYTVEVPVSFKFMASAKTDSEKLLRLATKFTRLRLKGVDVTYPDNMISIKHKEVQYTKEDIEEEERFWAQILGGVR